MMREKRERFKEGKGERIEEEGRWMEVDELKTTGLNYSPLLSEAFFLREIMLNILNGARN